MLFEGNIDLSSACCFFIKSSGSTGLEAESGRSYLTLSINPKANRRYLVQIQDCKKNLKTFSNLSLPIELGSEGFFNLEELVDSHSLDVAFQYSPTNGALLLRNEFGTVPLFYIFVPHKFFSFATSLSSLVKLPHIKEYIEINFQRVRLYFEFNSESNRLYSEDTFFTNINTVLPGHCLKINSHSKELIKYIKFAPQKWNHLVTKEDYSQNFRKLLEESVKRTAEDENTGSHLSGGLDSSALSALTKFLFPQKTLHTFYYDTDSDLAREKHHAKAVSEKIGSEHHEVLPQHNDFELLTKLIRHYGQPRCGITSPAFQVGLIESALKNGCNVLVAGHDGDSVAGNGFEHLYDLLDAGDVTELEKLIMERLDDPVHFRLYKHWHTYSQAKKFQLVKHLLAGAKLAGAKQRDGLIGAISLFLTMRVKLRLSSLYFVKKVIRHAYNKITKVKAEDKGILVDDFLRSYSSSKQARSIDFGNLSSEHQNRLDSVFSAQSIGVSEEMFSMADLYKIEYKMPLLDHQLLELSIATPSAIKYDTGHGRGHFRAAVKDLLPAEVLARQDKAIFTLYGVQSIRRMLSQATYLLNDSHDLWEVVDRQKFEAMKKILLKDNQTFSAYSRAQRNVLRTISLAIWLDFLKDLKKA